MSRLPPDIVFNSHGATIRFAAWYMAYGKGANAGIHVKINTKSGDGREVDPNDLFGEKVSATIDLQKLMSGMTYKDLMDLSKWASQAAEFVKKAEIKYRGETGFNKEHSVNGLKEHKDA